MEDYELVEGVDALFESLQPPIMYERQAGKATWCIALFPMRRFKCYFAVRLGVRGGVIAEVIFVDPDHTIIADQLAFWERWSDDNLAGTVTYLFLSVKEIRAALRGVKKRKDQVDVIFDELDRAMMGTMAREFHDFTSAVISASDTAQVSVTHISSGVAGEGRSRGSRKRRFLHKSR